MLTGPGMRWTAVLAGLLAGACTYDFDEPFSGSAADGGAAPSSATTSTTSASGGAASGGGGAGGTASSTGGATTTTTSAASSGGGGAAGVEDCTNGLDDDGDAAIDCADPECTSVACVPAPPAGWEGPFILVLDSGPQASCPAPLSGSKVGDVGLNAPPAQCAMCNCGAAAGSCSKTVTTYGLSGCGGVANSTTLLSGDVCTPFTAPDMDTAKATAPVVGGMCPASGGAPTIPQATWSQSAAACTGTNGGGCGPDVCAPVPAAGTSACVRTPGLAACPQPWTTEVVVFSGLDDTRDCTMCSCSAPQGAVCSGTTTIYTMPGCGGVQTYTVPANGTCSVAYGENAVTGSMLYAPVSSGACSASGGMPTGSCDGTSPVTYCCKP